VTLGALTPWLAAYVLASVVAAGLAAARGSFASGAEPDAAMR
jgi:hypothetical protein